MLSKFLLMGKLPLAYHPHPSNIVYFFVAAFPGSRFSYRDIVGLCPRNNNSSGNCQAIRRWLEPQALTDGHSPNDKAESSCIEEGGVLPGSRERMALSETGEGHFFLLFVFFFKNSFELPTLESAACSCLRVIIDNIHQDLLRKQN